MRNSLDRRLCLSDRTVDVVIGDLENVLRDSHNIKNNFIFQRACNDLRRLIAYSGKKSSSRTCSEVNGEFIGKRSVWTKDNRACWLEETTSENVKTWWCGENEDYEEIFKKIII